MQRVTQLLSFVHHCDDHSRVNVFTLYLNTNKTFVVFFQAGTTKVIFAYHPDDPSSENSILGHNLNNKGSRSILLLNSLEKIPTLPSDTKTFDILHDKVRI